MERRLASSFEPSTRSSTCVTPNSRAKAIASSRFWLYSSFVGDETNVLDTETAHLFRRGYGLLFAATAGKQRPGRESLQESSSIHVSVWLAPILYQACRIDGQVAPLRAVRRPM